MQEFGSNSYCKPQFVSVALDHCNRYLMALSILEDLFFQKRVPTSVFRILPSWQIYTAPSKILDY